MHVGPKNFALETKKSSMPGGTLHKELIYMHFNEQMLNTISMTLANVEQMFYFLMTETT